MSSEEKKYNAILIDTSIFERNGLRLEKGLLKKLNQFKRSHINLLFPDVIQKEVQSHLNKKIRAARSALEKSFNEAGDHLFFEGSALNDAKSILIDSAEIDQLAEDRINKFINETSAIKLVCGEFISVTSLLEQYFSNKPPFAESGTKKSEFPDAIVLYAVEKWVNDQEVNVLAVAFDKDWESYCKDSERIDYINDLSNALATFNKENAPYQLVEKLEKAIEFHDAEEFLNRLDSFLSSELERLTPDQDGESYLYWEPEGCTISFRESFLQDDQFKIIEVDEEYLVLEIGALIYYDAQGEFSLSAHDSIDKEYVGIGNVSGETSQSFETNILITLIGDLNGDINDLDIDSVELVSPLSTVDFGTIEPDFE